MKNLHIPSFIILVVSVFCVSAEHYELANAVQRSWTWACVIFVVAYVLSAMCVGKRTIIQKGKIVKTVCVVGILEILYSIVQLFGLLLDNYRYAPFSGSLNNPSIYGMYLSFCLPIAVYYSVRSSARERNAWRTSTVVFVVLKGLVRWFLVAIFLYTTVCKYIWKRETQLKPARRHVPLSIRKTK